MKSVGRHRAKIPEKETQFLLRYNKSPTSLSSLHFFFTKKGTWWTTKPKETLKK